MLQGAQLARGVAYLGQHFGRHSEQLAQPGAEAGLAQRVELRARRGRRIGGKARAEAVTEERVDRAHAQRPGLERVRHGLVVLEQPGQLGGGEVGVEGEATELLDLGLMVAEAIQHELGALVLPHHDRAERLAGLGVPGEHRLALMVESTGHYLLGRAGQQLGDGLDHDGQHLLAVLLDPARLGMAIDLVAAGLGHGTQLLVEQRRLDSGGPLVDAEQQHPRFLPHPSLSTAARCG